MVVFDVDGTLYDQRGLRLRMLREMFLHSTSRHTIEFAWILRIYRRTREELGDALHEDFESELIARTVALAGCSEEQVRATVSEWIEHRPLRHLMRYRFPKLVELFNTLRREGKIIGIYSDYPAHMKLKVLQLDGDLVVCAGDQDIRVLKLHAKGLRILMSRAAVSPIQTILIGDRPDRDGLAARAAGVRPLIRSVRPIRGWETFKGYDDPIFSAVGSRG